MNEHRRNIEGIFSFYKNIQGIDDVGVQPQNTKLYGEEFICFLPTIIAFFAGLRKQS